MGELEKRTRKSARRSKVQRLILDSIATAGILSVALVAPNVIKAMYKLGIMPRDRQKEYIASSASKLVKKGLMKFADGYYKLTTAGEKVLVVWDLNNYKLKRPRHWDRKWRMIIFDIPEKKRRVRRQITFLFLKAGLYRLQDSVWVYPYECEDTVALLKADFRLDKELLYMIVDTIEHDTPLKRHFGLASE